MDGPAVQPVSAGGRGEHSQRLPLREIVNCKQSELFIEFHYIWLCNIKSILLARSQNSEERLVASSRLSVRMEQLGSHWTDFLEI